jgi:hypothetical protein
VNLILPRRERRKQRGSNTAAEVVGKIGAPGNLVVFLSWHAHIVEHTDANENERQAQNLFNLQKSDGVKVNLQVNDRKPVELVATDSAFLSVRFSQARYPKGNLT